MALSREQIAARLRQLRESLGLTQAAVAAQLGVHRPTISEIEAGRRAVTAEELYRLARLYGASVAEILAEAPAEAVEAAELLALRSDDTNSPGVRLALKRFVADRKAEFELEELLGLAHPASAAIRREAPTPRSTMDAVEQGEALAALERQQLGLGAEPVVSVLHLLARQGVRIGPLRAMPPDRIDGVYFESTDLGPCVGVNWRDGDWTGGRAAFTAAHEYAHVILRDRAIETFHLAAGERDLQEVRANAFAAAFLMPEEGLRAYFARKGLLRGQTLTHLAPADVVRAMDYFGVSRSALLFRLQNLGLISHELAASLNDFTVGSVARAAGVTFREREYIGTRLPQLAIHAWRLGLITAGRAAELCDLDLQAFRDLMRELGEQQELDEDTPLVGASAAR
jgi:Zn-dependent peptidase ImmA (M78 family)/DNA-binding XRE family transcriptional regulator